MKSEDIEQSATKDASTSEEHAVSRRHWILAGLGVTAGLAGAMVAWQKFQPHAVMDEAIQNFWSQEFEKPEGGTLFMKALQGKPLLINFWATWCPPCIEELPLIDAFFNQNKSKSFQVVGLAVDQPSMVRRYLSQRPLSFPVGLAGFNGTELGKTLGNSQSVLPFSVIFDAKGRLLAQKAGKLDQSDLEAWLKKVS
jgi:thiol-disulfide isomerase/thioredoxin